VFSGLSRSPDLTPMHFFLWECVKNPEYVRPLPRDITDLKIRIRKAIQSIDRYTQWKTRDELLYRSEVIRVTNGRLTHIEYLRNKKQNSLSLFI
jgi:hypothetical protein